MSWDYSKRGLDVDPFSIIDFKSKSNVWYELISYLKAYFLGIEESAHPPEIKFLVRTGNPIGLKEDKKPQTSFRQEILYSLQGGVRKLISSHWVLVEQMFSTSCETEDANLTISVQDLLYTLNVVHQN